MPEYVFGNVPAGAEDPSIHFQGPSAAILPDGFLLSRKKKNIPQLLLSIKQHCFFLQAMCELLEFSIHDLVHDDIRDDGIRHGDLNTAMRTCSTLSLESENTKSVRRHSLTLLLVLIHFQAHGPQKECL